MTKGAPEVIIAKCAMDPSINNEIDKLLLTYGSNGSRIIGSAYIEITGD